MIEPVKLLPCPFCGGTNIDPEGWVSTERKGPACDDCAGCADTVELWNSRPLSQASAGGVVVTNEMVNAAWNEGKRRRVTGSTYDFRAVLEIALATLAASPSAGERWRPGETVTVGVDVGYASPAASIALATPPAPVQTASVEAVLALIAAHEATARSRADKLFEMDLSATDPGVASAFAVRNKLIEIGEEIRALTAPTQGDGGDAVAALEAEIERLRSANMQKHMEWQKTAAERAIFKRERDEAQSALAALAKTPSSPVSSPSPAGGAPFQKSEVCGDGCQHSVDVDMWPEHSCVGQCVYKVQEDIIASAAIASPSPAGGVREAAYRAAWEHVDSDLGWEMANQNASPHSLLAEQIARCKAMVDAALSSPATGEVVLKAGWLKRDTAKAAARVAEWASNKEPAMSVHEYVEGYEFRGDQDYKPNDGEMTLIEDAILGYLALYPAPGHGEGGL